MARYSKRQQIRGFSLTEMAIVVTIAASIVAGVWVVAGNVRQQKRVNDTLTSVLQINQNFRQLYANATPPAGAYSLTPALINAGVLPANLIQTTAAPCATGPLPPPCAVGPWGGQLTISSQYAGWGGAPTTNSKTFNLIYWNVPAGQCAALLWQVIVAAPTNKLVWYYSDGMGGSNVTGTETPSLPAIKNCSGVPATHVNLVFQYKL